MHIKLRRKNKLMMKTIFFTIIVLCHISLVSAQIEIDSTLSCNDSLNGEEVEYYENGNIRWKCNYLNGKLNGEVIYYYLNGNKEKQGSFINGIKNGWFYHWYIDGKLAGKMFYANDNIIGDIFYWDSNGVEKILSKDELKLMQNPVIKQ